MNDLEPESAPEAAQDDFEVEMSDLAPGDECQAVPPMRLTPGARAWRVVVIGSALLALVVILGSNPVLRGQALTLLAGTPTPTPPTAIPATTPSPPSSLALWLSLEERSLHLPDLTSGSACPVSHGRRVNHNIGPAVGTGPAYAVYGAGSAARGVLEYSDARFLGSSGNSDWGFQEMLWLIRPAYTGPALIRGRQIDGPNVALFNGGLDQQTYLGSWSSAPLLSGLRLLGNADGVSWGYWGTYIRLRAPGCYALQVDGLTFSYIVVFQAMPAPGL